MRTTTVTAAIFTVLSLAVPAFANVTDICIARIGGATIITGKSNFTDGNYAACVQDSEGTSLGTDVVDDNGKVRVSIGNATVDEGDTLKIVITDIESGEEVCTTCFTIPDDPISIARFLGNSALLVPSVIVFSPVSPVEITGLGPLTATVPLAGSLTLSFAPGPSRNTATVTVEAISLSLPSFDPGDGSTGATTVTRGDATTWTLRTDTGAFDGDISVRAGNQLGAYQFDSTVSGSISLDTRLAGLDITGMGELCVLADPAPPSVAFLRGDGNADGDLDIADSIFSLNALFQGGPLPSCMDAADANDDGIIDISDTIFGLAFQFLGGRAPPPPYPACGLDPTRDGLDPACRYDPTLCP